MNKAELSKLSIFNDLTRRELGVLEELAGARNFQKGTQIPSSDGRLDSLYLVKTGMVEVRLKTRADYLSLGCYKAGGIFGEVDFFEPNPPGLEFLAKRYTSTAAFDKKKLKNAFLYHRPMALKFLLMFSRTLSGKLRETTQVLMRYLKDSKIKPYKSREFVLEPDELKHLASLSRWQAFEKEDLIFDEGDRGDNFYIVLKGNVAITKRGPRGGVNRIATIRKGEIFGEMSFVDDLPRSAGAMVSSRNAEMLTIGRDMLNNSLEYNFNTSFRFLSTICVVLARRLIHTLERIDL